MAKITTIDDYIAAQPSEIAARLSEIRAIFHALVPEVVESISYGIPAFKIGKERLYISGYKNHIGMYPMYGITELDAEIANYRGKGTKDALHFMHDQPLPTELIKKIITAKQKA